MEGQLREDEASSGKDELTGRILNSQDE
jgi:hypothetical protein